MTATFLDKAGAAAATMLAMGGVLAVIALMGRVPLRLEVAGTKLDATYPLDKAFQAGKDSGEQAGLERALRKIEDAQEEGKDIANIDRELRESVRRIIETHLPVDAQDDIAEGSNSTTDVAEGYSGPAACRAAGITYRQLDYWARTGLVEPSVVISDSMSRRYSATDVVLLRVTKELLDTGVSLQYIRSAIDLLRERDLRELAQITLLSDGEGVFMATSPDQVVKLVEGGRGMYGINLARSVSEVQRALDGGGV
ncbi:MerR family transcriptional regulator [Pseudactinotalea sp.]|uniref:MerR family transcriptional regulator n=1 Tax=Pseudactinotalea sp. TaxID=1926260 RepID=UPI003B3AACD3